MGRIGRAYNTNIQDIIITGDFSYNMFSDNNNKMKDLLQHISLRQLIDEATHFTEQSMSLIDLIIVRNTNNVLNWGVAGPFIPDLTVQYLSS